MAEGTKISENTSVTSPITANNSAKARKMAELNYMKLHAGNILFSIYLREKNRFENAISRLEHKYGKSNVKTFVRNARWDGMSIFRDSVCKGCSLGYDIKSMVANDNVNSILKHSVTEVGKIIRNGRNELDEIILDINEKNDGVYDEQDGLFDSTRGFFDRNNKIFA